MNRHEQINDAAFEIQSMLFPKYKGTQESYHLYALMNNELKHFKDDLYNKLKEEFGVGLIFDVRVHITGHDIIKVIVQFFKTPSDDTMNDIIEFLKPFFVFNKQYIKIGDKSNIKDLYITYEGIAIHDFVEKFHETLINRVDNLQKPPYYDNDVWEEAKQLYKEFIDI